MADRNPEDGGPYVEVRHRDVVFRFLGYGVWFQHEAGGDWQPAIVTEIPTVVFVLALQMCVPAE